MTSAVILRLTSSQRQRCPALNVVCAQTQYIKPRSQIRTYDVKDVFESLHSKDHHLKLDHVLQIRKQKAFEEAKESVPELKERAMTVWKSTEGVGLTEAGIKVFEDIFRNEQQAATKRPGNFLKIRAYFEEILKKKKNPLSP